MNKSNWRRQIPSLVIGLLINSTVFAQVVINEIYPNPPGADSGFEWIELFNAGDEAVDIGLWQIETEFFFDWVTRYTLPGSTVLQANEMLVIGDTFVFDADLNLSADSFLTLGNASSRGEGVRISDSTNSVIDTVIYGPNNDDGLIDDTGGIAVTFAPIGAEGDSIARVPDGEDTDDSGADFVTQSPTIGAPNAGDPLVFSNSFEGFPDPLPGFGSIPPPSQVILEGHLADAESILVTGEFDFGSDGYDESDLGLLTPGAQTIINNGNSGGSSLLSEAFSYEWLARCNGMSLLKTTTEIVYDQAGSTIDYLVVLGSTKAGVSVTRGVGFPADTPLTIPDAVSRLEDKLSGLDEAAGNVNAQDAWSKGILIVVTPLEASAASFETAYESLSSELIAGAIVVILVTQGDDASLY